MWTKLEPAATTAGGATGPDMAATETAEAGQGTASTAPSAVAVTGTLPAVGSAWSTRRAPAGAEERGTTTARVALVGSARWTAATFEDVNRCNVTALSSAAPAAVLDAAALRCAAVEYGRSGNGAATNLLNCNAGFGTLLLRPPLGLPALWPGGGRLEAEPFSDGPGTAPAAPATREGVCARRGVRCGVFLPRRATAAVSVWSSSSSKPAIATSMLSSRSLPPSLLVFLGSCKRDRRSSP